MQWIIAAFILLLILAFYVWMFWHMSTNYDLPPCFITITNGNNIRQDWVAMFVVLNIFTAGYYYLTVYRN